MKTLTKLTLTASIAVLLSACSTTPQEAFQKQQEKIEAKQTAQLKQQMSNVPDWFMDYNPSDESGIYAVATSKADDVMVALDDAKTLALYEIANRQAVKFSSQKSLAQKKGSSGTTSNKSALVTDEFVNSKNMAGYKVVKRIIQQEGNMLRAYVMLFFPNMQPDDIDVASLEADHKQLLERIQKENAPVVTPVVSTPIQPQVTQ